MPGPTSKRFLVLTTIILAVAIAAIGVNWSSGVAATRLTTTPLNAITSFDSVAVQRYIGGYSGALNNNQKCAADVTNNGALSSNDSARIAQYVTSRISGGVPGTTVAAPCHSNWPTSIPILKGDVTGLDPVFTAGNGNADVSLPTITSPQGSVSIPVTVSSLTGMDVYSWDFQVTYDPAVLHPSGYQLTCHETPPGSHDTCYTYTGTLSNAMLTTVNATESGHIMVSSFSGSVPISGSGTMLILNFDVIGTEGQSSALTFEDYTGADSMAHQGFLFNEGQAAAVTTNGSLTVGPGHSTATATPTASSTATNTATPEGTPGSVPVSVSLPNVSAAEGSGITVPITVGNTTALGVISYDLQVTYDPAVLQPVSSAFDNSGTLSGAMYVNSYSIPTAGHLVIGAFRGTPISGAGTLLNLKFTVVGTAGQSTTLAFENYTDPQPAFHPGFVFNEGDPASTTTNGSVTVGVGGGEAISGAVTYGNAMGGQPTRVVPNVMVDGAGSTAIWTTTDVAGGDYSLVGFASGSYVVTPSKMGGANNAINSFDAAKVAQHVTGVSALTGNQLLVADVSENGNISSFDAAEIAAFAAGLPGAGATGTWKFSPASRTYASVSSVGNENYTGLLLGEVSGNWTNTGGRAFVGQTSSRKAMISIAAPRMTAQSGSDIVMPLSIRGAAKAGIISYEFDLRFDANLIRPQARSFDVAGTVSRNLSVVTNVIEPRLLRVVVYGPMPITEDGVLLNLRFTTGGKPGSISPLSFECIMVNDGDNQINTTGGQVEVF